jgi:hypothetical protein
MGNLHPHAAYPQAINRPHSVRPMTYRLADRVRELAEAAPDALSAGSR